MANSEEKRDRRGLRSTHATVLGRCRLDSGSARDDNDTIMQVRRAARWLVVLQVFLEVCCGLLQPGLASASVCAFAAVCSSSSSA